VGNGPDPNPIQVSAQEKAFPEKAFPCLRERAEKNIGICKDEEIYAGLYHGGRFAPIARLHRAERGKETGRREGWMVCTEQREEHHDDGRYQNLPIITTYSSM